MPKMAIQLHGVDTDRRQAVSKRNEINGTQGALVYEMGQEKFKRKHHLSSPGNYQVRPCKDTLVVCFRYFFLCQIIGQTQLLISTQLLYIYRSQSASGVKTNQPKWQCLFSVFEYAYEIGFAVKMSSLPFKIAQ